jgi:hypothetical protein
MQKAVRGIVMGAALALVCGGISHATDIGIPGKITVVKPGKLAKLVSKPAVSPLPLSGAPSGGSVRLKDLGNGDTNTYATTGGTWTGLGNPAGSKGYKYKGAGAAGDACKVILIKDKVVKAICKGPDVTLATTAFTGVASWRIDTGGGDRLCAELGGTTIKNQAGLLKRKGAPVPGGCASPSGAFVD